MRLGVTIVVVIWSALASAAAAQDARVASVHLSAPDGCTSLATFDDLLRARLGYAALREDAERVYAILVSARDGGYVGSLAEGEGEPRVVEGASCDAVVEALAMLTALAIDPLGEGAPAPGPAPVVVVGLPDDLERLDDEPPPAPRAARPPESGASEETRVFGEAQLVGNAGLASAITLGGGLGVGLAWSGFELIAEATVEATPIESFIHDAALRTWLWRAGAGPCVALDVFRGCATMQLGQAYVTSDLSSTPSTASSWVAYVAARFGFEAAAGGFHWAASLQLFVPILRPDIQFGELLVWEAPPIAGGLSLSMRLGARER